MKRIVYNLLSELASTIPHQKPIFNLGSLQIIGDEIENLTPLFPGMIGVDFRKGPGVYLVMDIQNITLPRQSAGTILCIDTLEHVKNPIQAMSEIYRTLKPGGFVFISSVMRHHIHAFPDDYWRFTPSCFSFLLEKFETRYVIAAGESDFPHTIFGIGCKGVYDFSQIIQVCELWKTSTQESQLKQSVRQWTPPAIEQIWVKIKRRIFGR